MRLAGRAVLVSGATCIGAIAVMAQPVVQTSAALLDGLRGCRAVSSVPDRAACYDAKVGAFLGAVDSGEVKLVDREEVRRTRRQLFGIPVPDLGIFKGDAETEKEFTDTFETTIASGRQTGPAQWRFTTAEGAVWEINNPPRKIKPIAAGDKVVFKKATLGYYFIRINGQLGVKGRRIS